jgi:hypothetical protein
MKGTGSLEHCHRLNYIENTIDKEERKRDPKIGVASE